MEADFAAEKLHPGDLKLGINLNLILIRFLFIKFTTSGTETYINRLLEPIVKKFSIRKRWKNWLRKLILQVMYLMNFNEHVWTLKF